MWALWSRDFFFIILIFDSLLMENLSFLVSQEGKRFMSFACVCGVHTHAYSCLHMCGNVSVPCACMCVYVDGEATGRCWKLLWLLWTLLTYTVFPWAWRWSIPLTRLSSQLLWDPVPSSRELGLQVGHLSSPDFVCVLWSHTLLLTLTLMHEALHPLSPLSSLGKILLA